MYDSDYIGSLRLHDSRLYSVEIRDREVRLRFRLRDSEVCLEIDDVKGLCIDNFLAGNIVFDISLYSAEEFPYTASEDDSEIVGKYIKYYGEISSTDERKLRVLLLSSSYGAEAIICFYGKINSR